MLVVYDPQLGKHVKDPHLGRSATRWSQFWADRLERAPDAAEAWNWLAARNAL